MEKFADLHLHTYFSDGNFTPEELAALGKTHGLAAMALTDHDTVEGCARMAAACATEGIEFITGTELTAKQDGVELHLLGYCMDVENEKLLSEAGRFQAVRQNRIREMVAKLNAMDVPLKVEAVFEIANCRSPGRPHVARALVKAGLCRSMDEAFDRFLKVGRPGWVPKCKISAGDAIRLIQQAGGVAVMAHPGLNKSDDLIPKMAEQGLDGIECFHTKHSAAAARHYLKLAEDFHLLVTGGSDCHGTNKGRPLVGSVKLPYEYVEKLKQRAAERRAELTAN